LTQQLHGQQDNALGVSIVEQGQFQMIMALWRLFTG